MSSRAIERERQALIDKYNARAGRVNGVTSEQQEALQGNTGTPNDSNRYLTELDGDGFVTKDTLHANTLLKADADHTPIELTVAASTIVGRAAAGGIDDLSAAQVRTILGLATTDSPAFVTTKLTGLSDGYLPYHVNDATGLADSPLLTDGTNVGLVGTIGATTAILVNLADGKIPYHVSDAAGLADGPVKADVDDAVTKKHTQGTDTGTSNATFAVGGLKFFGKSIQLADHAVQVLTTATANYPSHGFVQVCTTAVMTESAEFEMGSDGNVNIIRGTANVVANVSTTGKFCLGTVAAQNPLTIMNHLEATVQAIIQFWHA